MERHAEFQAWFKIQRPARCRPRLTADAEIHRYAGHAMQHNLQTSGNRMVPKHENKKNKVFASGREAQQELCLNCGISESPVRMTGLFRIRH